MPDNTGICEVCKYWVQTGALDEGLLGECRRNAPIPESVPSMGGSGAFFAVWPLTLQQQWCGCFEERPMAQEEVMARIALIEKMEAERKSKK